MVCSQDFEAVLRPQSLVDVEECKHARERKYDQEHIADLNKQLETAHRTIRASRW